MSRTNIERGTDAEKARQFRLKREAHHYRDETRRSNYCPVCLANPGEYCKTKRNAKRLSCHRERWGLSKVPRGRRPEDEKLKAVYMKKRRIKRLPTVPPTD